MRERKSLIRRDVAFSHLDKMYSSVDQSKPALSLAMSGVFLAFFVSLLAFVFFVDVKDRQSVQGVLHPKNGLASVYPRTPGIYTSIFVEEGDHVRQGDVLAIVSNEMYDAAGSSVDQRTRQRLLSQRRGLQSQLDILGEKHVVELELLIEKLGGLEKEIDIMVAEKEIIAQRFQLAAEEQRDYETLQKKKLMPEAEVNRIKSTTLALEQQLQSVASKIQVARNRRGEFSQQRRLLPLRYREAKLNLEAQLNSLDEEIEQLTSRRTYSLIAQTDGTIAAITARENEAANPNTALLSILPSLSDLVARMYVPPAAIGSIELGDEVQLSYDGYPVERYGLFSGEVAAISGQSVASEPTGKHTDDNNSRVYFVDVALQQQYVGSENNIALQSGMPFSADIVTNRRTIFQRVFRPLTYFPETKL